MIIESDLRCLVTGDTLLGEGPVWVAREGALYWVDIEGLRIFRWTEGSGAVDTWTPPFQVASLVPAADGGFLAGTVHGFAHIDPASGYYRPLARPAAEPPGNRFNDGKVDRHGRFWAGTMDDAQRVRSGALYRYGSDAGHIAIDAGYHVTNGPAFDLAGARMYHTDSGAQTIYAFDLDADGNAVGKRVFAQFGQGQGHPDGMTVDADDCLWVAFWDGWCLRRFDRDGQQIDELTVPVARATSCAFGGGDMRTMFITSARTGLTRAELETQPLAGSLFAVTPGTGGVAEIEFAGPLA